MHSTLFDNVFLAAGIALLVFGAFAGCSRQEPADARNKKVQEKEPVEIVYVSWASEQASSNIVKVVIEERLNRECSLLSVTLIAMWQSIAEGDKDGMVAGWLPSLQARFLEKYGPQVENLGPNLEGTRIGLVVPAYVDIDSIGQLSAHAEQFNRKIIGIDPHAGIMDTTKKAIDAYGLSDLSLVTGSGSTMTTALGNAVEEQRWIVVTGWTPHWKFARYDLEYLEDPKNVYGGSERINTIVRKGLQEDMPKVYAFLDDFHWQPEDMEEVMLLATDEDTSYYEAAKEWIRANEEKVNSWVE
jgi:glycine betaine/proline transport system substrate-binding protein